MSDPISGVFNSFQDFCQRPDPVYRKHNSKFQCPCCAHYTLESAGQYDICPVCFWEDDGTTGGHEYTPNSCTLNEARRNYLEFGANCKRDVPHVREPLPSELR